MAQKSISQGTLETGFEINNQATLALKVSKEASWMWLRPYMHANLALQNHCLNDGKIDFLSNIETSMQDKSIRNLLFVVHKHAKG